MRDSRKLMAIITLAALTISVALTIRGFALAQSTPQLVSHFVSVSLPVTDPAAATWQSAAPIEIPMTAQNFVMPMLGRVSVPTMQVSSINDGRWIAFRVEWPDESLDNLAITPDQFRDAAAIQFPVNQSIPGGFMGARGHVVNLWHWKADWQNDIDNGFQELTEVYPNFWKDYYPFAVGEPPFRSPEDFASDDARRFLTGWAAGNPLSDPYRLTPIEELTAEGFGTATNAGHQAVIGRGVWEDGRWSVVFARPLVTADSDQVQFRSASTGNVAFAIWNGANQEVGGRKQISNDIGFRIEAPPAREVVAPGIPGEPVRTIVQISPQGPSTWWIIIPAVAAGAIVSFLMGGLGVLYLFYRRQETGQE